MSADRIPVLADMSGEPKEQATKTGKALLGFIVAPLAPCVLILVLAMFQAGRDDGTITIAIMAPVSYTASLVVGLPIHILLTKTNHTKIIHYIAAAVVATLVPVFAIFIYPAMTACSDFSQCLLPSHFTIMGIMLLAGVLVATTFWLIVRPDRAAG
jgi:hypothetical protein